MLNYNKKIVFLFDFLNYRLICDVDMLDKYILIAGKVSNMLICHEYFNIKILTYIILHYNKFYNLFI